MKTEPEDRPMVLVGFVAAAVATIAEVQPAGSVVWIEEPDVVRKRAAHEKVAGAEVVRELIEWEHLLPGKADEFYHAHRDLNPCAVVPLTEYATPFAARLAERFGLPGATYGAALILRDKALLRRVTGAAGIANPESVEVTGAEQAAAFLRSVGGPIVLKPANRQASVGVQIVHDAAGIDAAWAACTDQDEGVFVPDRPMELRMLAERYVSGTEFSVEMLFRAGEPLFANVTGKQLFPGDRPVEAAHVVPADIAEELAGLLKEQTAKVLRAAGFSDGIAHCEWIVPDDGVPHLVECAGRFAGDGIIDLIQRAYPVELARCYYAVMKGRPLPAELPEKAAGGAAVRFLTIEPGLVTAVSGAEEAAAGEGVYMCDVSVSPGDRFDGLRSSWDRVADLMVSADSPAEALRLADAAAASIRITVEPLEPVAAATTGPTP
jgi:biotin carboxylase